MGLAKGREGLGGARREASKVSKERDVHPLNLTVFGTKKPCVHSIKSICVKPWPSHHLQRCVLCCTKCRNMFMYLWLGLAVLAGCHRGGSKAN